MTDGKRTNLLVLILAVIGAIAVLAVLGTWLMHGTMMGGPMMGGGSWLIGLLILGEPMSIAFEVRGAEPGRLPAEGSTIRATVHVEDGRYWLTDVRPEQP